MAQRNKAGNQKGWAAGLAWLSIADAMRSSLESIATRLAAIVSSTAVWRSTISVTALVPIWLFFEEIKISPF